VTSRPLFGRQVSIRYASHLVTVFVCYLYGGAMPCLFLLAALSFWVGYWVDKFLFLRYYRYGPVDDASTGTDEAGRTGKPPPTHIIIPSLAAITYHLTYLRK
jgi:hypothetical protein